MSERKAEDGETGDEKSRELSAVRAQVADLMEGRHAETVGCALVEWFLNHEFSEYRALGVILYGGIGGWSALMQDEIRALEEGKEADDDGNN